MLVNPSYEAVGGGRAAFFEGCPSVPGWQAVVARHAEVRLVARDEHGRAVDEVFAGWPARIVQHETDHLDGVLYLDRAELRSLASNRAMVELWGQVTPERAAVGLGFGLPSGAAGSSEAAGPAGSSGAAGRWAGGLMGRWGGGRRGWVRGPGVAGASPLSASLEREAPPPPTRAVPAARLPAAAATATATAAEQLAAGLGGSAAGAAAGAGQLSRYVLQQPQPYLADRRVRRDRVPQAALIGTRPATATVAEWIISPTPGPTKVTPRTISSSRSTTMRARGLVALAVQARAGHRGEVDVDAARTRWPACSASARVRPTEAASGSVNTTWGTASWSAVAACAPHGPESRSGTPEARAAMAAPAMRAWYLPDG